MRSSQPPPRMPRRVPALRPRSAAAPAQRVIHRLKDQCDVHPGAARHAMRARRRLGDAQRGVHRRDHFFDGRAAGLPDTITVQVDGT